MDGGSGPAQAEARRPFQQLWASCFSCGAPQVQEDQPSSKSPSSKSPLPKDSVHGNSTIKHASPSAKQSSASGLLEDAGQSGSKTDTPRRLTFEAASLLGPNGCRSGHSSPRTASMQSTRRPPKASLSTNDLMAMLSPKLTQPWAVAAGAGTAAGIAAAPSVPTTLEKALIDASALQARSNGAAPTSGSAAPGCKQSLGNLAPGSGGSPVKNGAPSRSGLGLLGSSHRTGMRVRSVTMDEQRMKQAMGLQPFVMASNSSPGPPCPSGGGSSRPSDVVAEVSKPPCTPSPSALLQPTSPIVADLRPSIEVILPMLPMRSGSAGSPMLSSMPSMPSPIAAARTSNCSTNGTNGYYARSRLGSTNNNSMHNNSMNMSVPIGPVMAGLTASGGSAAGTASGSGTAGVGANLMAAVMETLPKEEGSVPNSPQRAMGGSDGRLKGLKMLRRSNYDHSPGAATADVAGSNGSSGSAGMNSASGNAAVRVVVSGAFWGLGGALPPAASNRSTKSMPSLLGELLHPHTPSAASKFLQKLGILSSPTSSAPSSPGAPSTALTAPSGPTAGSRGMGGVGSACPSALVGVAGIRSAGIRSAPLSDRVRGGPATTAGAPTAAGVGTSAAHNGAGLAVSAAAGPPSLAQCVLHGGSQLGSALHGSQHHGSQHHGSHHGSQGLRPSSTTAVDLPYTRAHTSVCQPPHPSPCTSPTRPSTAQVWRPMARAQSVRVPRGPRGLHIMRSASGAGGGSLTQPGAGSCHSGATSPRPSTSSMHQGHLLPDLPLPTCLSGITGGGGEHCDGSAGGSGRAAGLEQRQLEILDKVLGGASAIEAEQRRSPNVQLLMRIGKVIEQDRAERSERTSRHGPTPSSAAAATGAGVAPSLAGPVGDVAAKVAAGAEAGCATRGGGGGGASGTAAPSATVAEANANLRAVCANAVAVAAGAGGDVRTARPTRQSCGGSIGPSV